MQPTIYVITNYQNNHYPGNPLKKPFDNKFLDTDFEYIFYLIDKKVPLFFKNKKTIIEYDVDPVFAEAGKKFFAEWSFLLSEAKHNFCQYPFFMISSRFYEKNNWLQNDLSHHWKTMFDLLNKYKYGYLPSYDRPLRWVYFDLQNRIKRKEWEYRFCPFTENTTALINNIFQVDISKEYNYSSDLFCNYIGFNNRDDLLNYVKFYMPLINHFFDEGYNLKNDFSKYVRYSGIKNEKPFTFLLELISHLFFFKNKIPFFALHYDGFYEIDEAKKMKKKIVNFNLTLKSSFKHFVGWHKKRITTESYFCKIIELYKKTMKKNVLG